MTKPTEYSESGQPIYKYEDQEREWIAPSYGEEGWAEKIEEHVQKYYGATDNVFHEIISDLIHIDVHHIPPTEERNYHVLFTTGMSFLPMNVPQGLEDHRFAELMICLPASWSLTEEALKDENNYWPIRWLKLLAKFPHDYQTWLGWGHTMPAGNPPVPLSEQTKMNGVILLPPICMDFGFHVLKMDEERSIRFYAVIPLYQEEMDYKLKHGLDALMDRFDKHGINEVIDLQRKNVCKSSPFFWKR